VAQASDEASTTRTTTGRVVEPRLRLEGRPQARQQRQLAQHREHRRGVGRGDDAAEDDGVAGVDAQDQVGQSRDDGDAHRHADRRQDDGERQRRPHHRPPGRQPALGEDQRQRQQPSSAVIS
jgi:hypothetical protein